MVVRNPVRKTRAGWQRRETVMYAEILDREAQRLGEDIDAFVRRLERVRRDQMMMDSLLADRRAVKVKMERTIACVLSPVQARTVGAGSSCAGSTSKASASR